MSMNVANSSTYLNPGSQRNRSSSEEQLVPGNNGSAKKFKILSAIFGLTTLILIIVVAVVAAKKKDSTAPAPAPTSGTTPAPATTPEPAPKVCYSPDCRDAAAHFLTIMNLDADPCNDFFDYVCGKWSNETEIPKQKSRYGVFDDLRDDLAKTCVDILESPVTSDTPVTAIDNSRLLYQACMNTEDVKKQDGVAQLQQILASVDISFTASDMDPKTFVLNKTLSKITKLYGLNYIVSFTVSPDDKNTTTNIITLDQQDDFGLPRNFLLGNSSSDQVSAYKKFITKSLCLLNNTETDDCSYLNNAVESIFDFEVSIAERTRDLVDRRSAATWYFKMSFEKLQEGITEFNFLDYSKDILGKIGENITAKTDILVKEETYLRNVSQYLSTVPKGTQSSYLAWRLVQQFGPFFFKDFRKIKFEFDQVLQGIQEPVDLKLVCFDKTNEYFGHAVGRMYVDKAFDEDSKKEVEGMVNNLAEAFRKLLDKNDWMDEDTKNQSRVKLTKMVDMIGFPEWTKNDTELNKYYEGAKMTKGDISKSLATVMGVMTEKALSALNVQNNRSAEWITPASIVNAFYNPSANSITFPAGILQVPFYGKRPRFLNYGAIGYVIGHEITHGYDDQGSEFDGEGNFVNWWSNETREEFDKRKDCFIKQYTDIVDPLSGRNLNGSQTIGENIADNGGIREAYQAYLLSGRVEERLPGFEDFSDLKMFYLSAASVWCTKFRKEGMINSINDDVHAPGMYRAYVPLANTDEFAEVFSCPEGSKMNPKNRCRIW